MGATSGHYGKIMVGSSNLVECMGWSFNKTATANAYKTCGTVGTDGALYTKRVGGARDGTGSINGLQDPDDDIENYIDVGSFVTLLLYWTPTRHYSVPSEITKLNVEVDIDSGVPVPWEADFECDGQWTQN